MQNSGMNNGRLAFAALILGVILVGAAIATTSFARVDAQGFPSAKAAVAIDDRPVADRRRTAEQQRRHRVG
jgi:hypothetical protein